MGPELDFADERLEHCRKLFCETSITLAALAVVRKREVSVKDACKDISRYTADTMNVGETQMARELDVLERQGYVERKGDLFHITVKGKNFMFEMMKVWNTYVDAMNNLWGCYYGA